MALVLYVWTEMRVRLTVAIACSATVEMELRIVANVLCWNNLAASNYVSEPRLLPWEVSAAAIEQGHFGVFHPCCCRWLDLRARDISNCRNLVKSKQTKSITRQMLPMPHLKFYSMFT